MKNKVQLSFWYVIFYVRWQAIVDQVDDLQAIVDRIKDLEVEISKTLQVRAIVAIGLKAWYTCQGCKPNKSMA